MRTIAAVVAGSSLALIGWELALRPVAGDLRTPPRPDVACDSLISDTIVTRQFDEGMAVARFSSCGARLTGHAPQRRAPWLVLLGDSHVAAREVDDAETVGGRIEAMAHDAGVRLNVRQYGWGGAGPGQYVYSAKAILDRWHPVAVVVLLSADDFGADTTLGLAPRVRVTNGGYRVDTTGMPRGGLAGAAPRSGLVAMTGQRWRLFAARSPRLVRRFLTPPSGNDVHMDENPVGAVADASVRALLDAYGERLQLVFLSDVRAVDGEAAPAESLFVAACARTRARCTTMRPAMLDARMRGHLARGFTNTVIGVGHLNAFGHDLVAREVWSRLQPSLPR